MNILEWAQDKILVGRKLTKIREKQKYVDNNESIKTTEASMKAIKL